MALCEAMLSHSQCLFNLAILGIFLIQKNGVHYLQSRVPRALTLYLVNYLVICL